MVSIVLNLIVKYVCSCCRPIAQLALGLVITLVTGLKYHCTVCKKMFKTESELQTHQCGKKRRVSGKEKTHKCDTCGKMFGLRGSLTRHIRVVHDKIARLSCPYCKYRTDRQHNLTTHMAIHTGDKNYKCTHCYYTATEKKNLTTHIYHHHTNKTYKCQYKQCGVRKPSVEELHEHIRSNHPVQQHRCDQCPMSFKTAHLLTQHKRTHGEVDSRYECKYCGKRFTLPGHLKKHSLTHTGERPHKCSVCGKGFTVRCNLTTHMRIHTGENPFSCSYCDKRFSDSGNKNKHEITCENRN